MTRPTMTAAETARTAIADALDILLHDEPIEKAADLLVEAFCTLGGDPTVWPEYPAAAARGATYATRP